MFKRRFFGAVGIHARKQELTPTPASFRNKFPGWNVAASLRIQYVVKLVPKSGNFVARIFARFALVWRRAFRAFWPRGTKFIQAPPKRFTGFIIALLIIGAAALGGTALLRVTGDDMGREAWTISQITQLAQNRLKAIATALDSARDWLAGDQAIESAIAGNSVSKIFSLLGQRDQAYSGRMPDSALFVTTSKARTAANRGYAVYSAEGRLMAWHSPVAATFGFDTVLSSTMRLPSRDQGLILENGPIYAYLVAVRKIVSISGQVEAYIVAKQQLAVKEPLTSSLATSFIDDIKERAGRNLSITFGGRAAAPHSAGDSIVSLLADPTDPASFIGNLVIGRNPQPKPSLQYEVYYDLFSFAFSIAVFSLLVWLLTAIAEVPKTLESLKNRRQNGVRIVFSALVFFALAASRVIIAQLGALEGLFGPVYRESTSFSATFGFGIAGNPIELFVTTVFATAGAIMLWIVWLPRERLVRDDSRNRELEGANPNRQLGLALSALGALLVSKLLVDGLSLVIESIVRSGNLRYLTVKQVLPAPAMLMMFLSFLGIGVTYLFLGTFTLTVALRSAINFTSRRLSLGVRIFLGSSMMAFLIFMGVVFLDEILITDTSLTYRACLAALTFVISAAIIIIDARVPDPLDEGPSFLYKLPRSSRPILFILAISAVIISPLVATKQLLKDEDAARRIVRENSEVDIPGLQNAAGQLMLKAEDRLSQWYAGGHDSSALHDEAFLIWLEGMREHPGWNASIDLYGAGGARLSHFATEGVESELDRLRTQSDSEFSRLRRSDTAKITSRILPSFTSSGSPAIIAGLRFLRPSIGITDSAKPAPTSQAAEPLFVTASIWGDLPSLASERSRVSIGPAAAEGSESDPVTSGGFIVAQYRPGVRRLTNSPGLDVPANVPDSVMKLLLKHRNVWTTNVIGGARYQTLYYRATAGLAAGDRPTIVSVSVPEPSYGRTLEFALRLNAIGLLCGALIVIALLIVRQVAARRLRFTLHFRDRIFLIVLVIALVPLVVVTYVTRDLLAERAQVEQQDRLSRDASVIKDRITRQIELAATPQEKTASERIDLQSEVEYLSQVIGRDFSIYDASGRLRASIRPELYESSLLSTTLNSAAVEEVILGKRSFFTEPVLIGSETYEVGYQPVASAGGDKLLAVLALATMDEKPLIEAEIARTTSFIYSTFAALGLILLGIGALFAARVAKPILELIRATQQVARGKLTTSIPVRREDEIGDLMHAFNTMKGNGEASRA
jgi:HAMP domain-containing protein